MTPLAASSALDGAIGWIVIVGVIVAFANARARSARRRAAGGGRITPVASRRTAGGLAVPPAQPQRAVVVRPTGRPPPPPPPPPGRVAVRPPVPGRPLTVESDHTKFAGLGDGRRASRRTIRSLGGGPVESVEEAERRIFGDRS